MTRALLTLWLLAQLGPDARPVRCWVMPGLDLRQTTIDCGPQWVGRDGSLGGWLMAVCGRSVGEAAAKVGLKGCEG